jgi:hypothetical protein
VSAATVVAPTSQHPLTPLFRTGRMHRLSPPAGRGQTPSLYRHVAAVRPLTLRPPPHCDKRSTQPPSPPFTLAHFPTPSLAQIITPPAPLTPCPPSATRELPSVLELELPPPQPPPSVSSLHGHPLSSIPRCLTLFFMLQCCRTCQSPPPATGSCRRH